MLKILTLWVQTILVMQGFGEEVKQVNTYTVPCKTIPQPCQVEITIIQEFPEE